MPKLDNMPSRGRVFRANHLDPGDFQMDYILLPVGYSYNCDWITAKRGDKVRLFDGGLHKIHCVRVIKVRGGLADTLSRIRYGITIAGCIQRWKDNAKLEGHTRNAVSDTECLWVVYEKEQEN